MASGKGYYIINKLTGVMVARHEIEKGQFGSRIGGMVNTLNPLSKEDMGGMMTVFKDRCLVVSKSNEGRYLVEGRQTKNQDPN